MCWLVPFVAAAGFAGYQQIFSTLAPYDDEGYVMVGVAHYLRGLPLYEEIYTQYGPGLFVVEAGFHQFTGLPVTHDVVRLRTWAVWLITAFLCGAAAARITRAWWMGPAAFAAAFLHLERLCLEPGHPQEICVFAIAGCLLLASYLSHDTTRGWVALGMGVLVGLTLMTKLNVGVFLFAAIVLAMFASAVRSRIGDVTFLAAVPPALLLPLALTRGHWDDLAAMRLPAAVLSGIAGTLLIAWEMRRSKQHGEACVTALAWFLGSAGATCGVLAGVVLARGVSPAMLWYGLVGQHQGFAASAVYHPAPLPTTTLLLAIGGLVAAAFAARGLRLERIVPAIAALLVLGAAWSYLHESNSPLLHGLTDRGAAGLLIAGLTPLAWVVLLPLRNRDHRESAASSHAFGRLALAAIAVFQPLGAYPVPGTQMAVGSLPLLLAGLVATFDLASSLQRQMAPTAGHTQMPRTADKLTFGLLLLFAAILVYRDYAFWRYRDSLIPLAMPGASRLRVPAETAAQNAWVANILRKEADTFLFGEHTQNSLYFWTGLEPPTALNATVWPYMLRPAEQERIVASLRGRDRVWLIRDAAYPHAPPLHSPLADFLAANSRRHASFGRMELWSMRLRK